MFSEAEAASASPTEMPAVTKLSDARRPPRPARCSARGRCARRLRATVLALGHLLAVGSSCAFGMATIERIEAPGLAGAYVVRPSVDDHDEVHLNLIVLAGEADNRGTEGIAHYVEHLAWLNATGRMDRDFVRHSNAWTRAHSTTYRMSGRASDFAELAQNMLRVFEPFELEQRFMLEERDIILREHEHRVGEDPYAPLRDDLARRLHGDNPPARSVLGHPDDIASFSLDEARTFHRQTHRPENAVLIVRGEVSGEDLQRVLRQMLGPATAASDVRPPHYTMGAHVRDVRTRVVPGLTRPALLYFKVVKLPLAERRRGSGPPDIGQRLALLHEVLDSSLPGGLAKPLRFDNFIAASYRLGLRVVAPRHLQLEFFAHPDRGVSPDTLLRAFEQAMSDAGARGIPVETFERARRRHLDELKRRRDRRAFEFDELVRVIELRTGKPPRGLAAYREDGRRITRAQLDTLLRALAGPGRVVATKAQPVQ